MPARNQVQAPTSIVHTDISGTVAAGVATAPPVSGTDEGLQVYANLGSEVVAVQQNTDGAADWDTTQVALNSSSATLVLAANSTRRSALVTNMSATINIYVGPSNVTTSNGQLIAPGNSLTIPATVAIYAISASSTPTVCATEVYN